MNYTDIRKALLIAAISVCIPVSMPYAAGPGCGSSFGTTCDTAPSAAQLQDPSTGPNANKAESEACDANFMNQIYAKAFLEAEREVVVANTTILKPDSVLEYSCLDQLVTPVAEDAGPIFSESDRWSTDNIDVVGDSVTIDVFMGDTRLDSHIEAMTLQAVVAYANEQFPHDFLGGAASGDDHTLQTTIGGGGPCDFMFNMNHIAKCEDFGLNPPFIEFEDFFSTPALESTDPRTLPVVCPALHQVTPAVIAIAKNEDWTWAANDPVVPQFEIARSAEIGSCENSDPIPTGVTVYYKEYDQDPAGNPIVVDEYEYEDKFCSNPACFFENNGNASGGDDTCERQP
jgi:hypothetical protein